MNLHSSKDEIDGTLGSYVANWPSAYQNGMGTQNTQQPISLSELEMPLSTSSCFQSGLQPPYFIGSYSSYGFPTLSPLADYKMPIQPTAARDIEDSACHRLPFIFIMNPDGSLDYVHVSIDVENSFWKTLQPASESFLSDIKGFDYENTTVHQMKEVLRKYGLNSTGKKQTLIQKIEQVKKILLQLK